jgi:ParB family chromosome partitioning protein
MFHQNFPLSELRPAPYNPRQIGPEAIEQLRASLKTLGPVKAVIARDDRTIVAGHQRSKNMIAVGITHAPVYLLRDISDADEVRFNQIHNSADIEIGGCRLRIKTPLTLGWHVVQPNDIEVISKSNKASQLSEICKLLTKFGEWGNCVADPAGRVLASPLYALACHNLRKPLRVCVLPQNKGVSVLRYLGQQYGEFSYSHLPEQMWAQTFAQMKRLRREGATERPGTSRLYSRIVIPRIKPGMRILDFGAGQMDYVKKLKAAGHNIMGLEFYLRKQGSDELNVGLVQRHITQLCKELRNNGPFDMVVCDSVLNSVTSVEAENAVLGTLNALCKPGGLIAFSGRSRSFSDRLTQKRMVSTGKTRDVWFLDQNGITAMYQRGIWLYQKFHTLAQVRDLANRFIGPDFEVVDYDGPLKGELKASSWGVVGTKAIDLPTEVAESALRFEFNLPLPEGERYGRGQDIVDAWQSPSC